MGTSVLSISETNAVRLDIRVEEADWRNKYDRLEVWRSVLGEGGPYTEVTGASWASAQIPEVSVLGPASQVKANINGKKLLLRVNERIDITVTFTGTDPMLLSTAASQVSPQAGGHVFSGVTENGVFVIQSRPFGGAASIRVVGGDAAPLLGLPTEEPESLAFGRDPRIVLREGVSSYVFTDYYSTKDTFYRTRFSHSLTLERSEFSESFGSERRVAVDPSNIVLGFVKLARPDGRPAAKTGVTIFNTFNAKIVQGFTITGGPKRIITDDNGYAEVPLVRGITIDVGVEGTNLIRKVTVPSDISLSRFDMLDPLYGQDDNFSVQRAEVPYADRKTL